MDPSILARLSSQVGDRSEAANRQVVLECLDDRDLLNEIAGGLHSKDTALVGDCAEVLTQVAGHNPEWVAPFAEALAALTNHKNTRVRWEATHALALVATEVPPTTESLLPRLAEMIRGDKSVIVRDYATDAVANFAAVDKAAATQAYPLLIEALTVWNGKHAGHALKGLANVAMMVPALHDELRAIAQDYVSGGREVVRKAARELSKAITMSSPPT